MAGGAPVDFGSTSPHEDSNALRAARALNTAMRFVFAFILPAPPMVSSAKHQLGHQSLCLRRFVQGE